MYNKVCKFIYGVVALVTISCASQDFRLPEVVKKCELKNQTRCALV
ncbi:hypothetical protein GD1_149 [Paraglaciecola Antarctic GD virus 1]|nr:hypothetical protein GD1_149 [Paraglaciecola Antarctic GD virus 1]